MKKEKELHEIVDDGIGYFLDMGYIDELTTDKRYYVNQFIDYIHTLQADLIEVKRKINKIKFSRIN